MVEEDEGDEGDEEDEEDEGERIFLFPNHQSPITSHQSPPLLDNLQKNHLYLSVHF
ncbi:MAG TPA: hypothetical protein VK203_18320 [Nostocaceae cyanobacterium]|nr:hypothetical protein [Nostocaceae cyanobacterium]